ncbi:MAG: von Willebrand factor, type [Acidimicrobiales bacterium]|nr:von Willebrand factor, type [Acidimicrobiales bacterium]
MTLLAPSRLWLLVLVGAAVAGYLVLEVRRRRDAARFASPALLPLVAPSRPGWRRHVAAVLSGLALVALVVGLARPARAEQVPRTDGAVVLVLDVSSSMEATDVAPSRLAAAVDAADGFVGGLPDGLSVGLVAYDRTPRVLATPTTDHDVVRSSLGQLTTRRGTDTAAALQAALDALPEQADGDASVVLLSDGDTNEDAAEAVARDAADRDIPVSTIAYGTDAGTVTVDGEEVAVPANPDAMRALAELTGGASFEAASADELQSVYDDISGDVSFVTEQRELVGPFLFAALVALSAAFGASLLWTARFL